MALYRLTLTATAAAWPCIWWEDAAFLAAAIACWSSESHDFCLIGGAVDGGDCVCGAAVEDGVAGVEGVGGGTGVTGVAGMAGEAGVGGGVAVMLAVEAVDMVDTDPELCVCDTPQLIPLTELKVAEAGNAGSPPKIKIKDG